MRRLIIGLTVAVLGSTGASGADASTVAAGIWRNAKNTVHVKLQPCGSTMCGTVVWAAPKAQAKARAAGQQLVGAQLLREFRTTGPGRWQGRVFVPHLNRTFSGTMKSTNPHTMIGRGCLVGGFFCKEQTWIRIT